MKTVEGICTTAKIFTDNVEDYALAQIKMLCDNDAFKNTKIRIMPDVHPGKVVPIGFVCTNPHKILPSIIGSDIGCGISIVKLKEKRIELPKLDSVIRGNIPSGFNIRTKPKMNRFDFDALECVDHINIEKAELSLGTLGGGNHFIEIDKDDEENLYLVVHSGSRHLGKEVTDYYLKEGQKHLKSKGIEVPYELTWLENDKNDTREKYLDDIEVIERYAELNRLAIMDEILKGMKLKGSDEYLSISHNHINYDFTNNEITKGGPFFRKGAISAHTNEKVVIPVNMKDGIILGTGLGNSDWNYSAPHGAGRIMNRENVKSNFTVSRFKLEMKGIHCTCIGKDTLDEAPFAYRRISEIKEAISDTVRIDKILTPVYNFKAGGKEK